MAKYHVGLAGAAPIIGILVGLIAAQLIPVAKAETPAPVQFDHSNCQYPDRWSNPVDGCDNSDPAVPECIKAIHTQEAEQACIAAFVKQHEKPAPSEPVTTTPASDEQIIYSCGGK